jgi:acyl-CoA synthetase (AMP-forming)/AMP-acid ligase II
MAYEFSPAFTDYLPALRQADEPFLFYYDLPGDEGVERTAITRGEFLSLVGRAAGALKDAGCDMGDRVLHCFGANHYLDLAFRLAGGLVGTVPVTVNWQADTAEGVGYKLEKTEARTVLVGPGFETQILEEVRRSAPGVSFLEATRLDALDEINPAHVRRDVDIHSTKIIIFTSGTTGQPKGVQLPYRSYRTNRLCFDQMLGIAEGDRFAALAVNPLHHTNSTAITDWALRHPASHIHLVQRYSTRYWAILEEVATAGYDRVVAPTVSRHFDFLEELATSDRLPIEINALKSAMSKVDFLIGSAPVGPATIARLRKYAGRTPAVRFGSTETCLQVMGIPHEMDEEARLGVFNRGWSHQFGGEPLAGYYVGRPHKPHTQVRVVRSIRREEAGFMQDVAEGTPGYLVTRGGNLMSGYVGDPAATAEVFHDGWYLGLKDIGFALTNLDDGEPDFFWVSRDTSLLIRGGANYSAEQIAAELTDFVVRRYGLPAESFSLAVVGLKVDSEHEDACCVIFEPADGKAAAAQAEIEASFVADARPRVSKGARPDFIRIGRIPPVRHAPDIGGSPWRGAFTSAVRSLSR